MRVEPPPGLPVFAVIGWFLLLASSQLTGSLNGQPAAMGSGGVTIHSRSGQFIIHSPRFTRNTLNEVTPIGTNSLIRMEPDPLAVSCERIKSALLDELDLRDQWQGKVHINIDPRARTPMAPTVAAHQYADGWQYSLRVPGELESPKLVRAVVHALLLEMANRTPGPNLPDIPLWLVEGLTGQIQSRIGPDPVARPTPMAGKYGGGIGALADSLSNRRLADDRRRTLYHLLARPPLSLEEICLPSPGMLAPDSIGFYRLNCQLLLDSLRRLPGGMNSLQTMLGLLPQALNWQTAFLTAYQAQFPRLLDAEKWWALRSGEILSETGKTQLPADVGALRLDDLLSLTVEVRANASAAPRREAITLQALIQDWDFSRQEPVLTVRASQLRALARVLPPELRSLATGYARTLQSYVEERKASGSQPTLPGLAGPYRERLIRTTLDQLTTMDRQRGALRGREAPPADATGWTQSGSSPGGK